MSEKAQAPTGTHFDVPSQSGGSIANVGGNLYVGGERRRGASIGRAAAAIGLALFFVGLFLLGFGGVSVYRETDWNAQPIDLALPAYTAHAVGLLVTGIILNRFGRLFASH